MSDSYQPEHRAGDPAVDQEDNFDDDPVIGDPPPRLHVLFSNAVYDNLKWVTQVVLPALALFYISMAPLWGFPKQEEVAGTIVAVDLFLGTVLGLSNVKYKKETEGKLVGFIDVERTEDGRPMFGLNFPGDPMQIPRHDKVTFKVRNR